MLLFAWSAITPLALAGSRDAAPSTTAPRREAFVPDTGGAVAVFASDARTREDWSANLGWFVLVAGLLLLVSENRHGVLPRATALIRSFAVWFFALYSRPPPLRGN